MIPWLTCVDFPVDEDVDQGSKSVSFDVPAHVRGGADKVIYLVRTTEGETGAAESCLH
ncbi:hypothetical protein OHB14_11875 [Streptomyces sp. NBC_01613]|uniref:hypothetical protein n=1 Tax=Streptomyces sp. NBC_01613 TaxID=2975896 RepID=UPI0038678757